MLEFTRWFTIATLLLAAGVALADPQPFALTAADSHIEVATGSEVTLRFGSGQGSQITTAIPFTAPTSGTGIPVPGGTTGDGLHTALQGALSIEVSEARDTIRFVGRRSNIELVDSGTWLPGPPTDRQTATTGDLAVQFDNGVLQVVGNAVLRDVVLSLDSGGQDLPLTSTGSNTWTFQAGCGSDPCLRMSIEDATLDGETTLGPIGRIGLRIVDVAANPGGVLGSLEELSSGELRVTLPISISGGIEADELGSPIESDLDLVLAGQIVAVPEPTRNALVLAALVPLVIFAVRRRLAIPRRPARFGRFTVVALLAASVSGCWGPPTLNAGSFGTISFTGSFLCLSEQLGVTKTGSPAGSIGNFSFPSCRSRNFSGDFTTAPVNFLLNLFFHAIQTNLQHGFATAGISTNFDRTTTTTMEISRAVQFRHSYTPFKGTGLVPQFFGRAQAYGLGAAFGEEIQPALTLNLCGIDQDLPVDGEYHFFDLDAQGGDIMFDLSFESERISVGTGTQMLGVAFGIRGDLCMNNHQCVDNNAETPYCSPTGCSDGTAGATCSHDRQCAGSAGLFCSSLEMCSSGEAGSDCVDGEGDCDAGLTCSAMLCAAP